MYIFQAVWVNLPARFSPFANPVASSLTTGDTHKKHDMAIKSMMDARILS